MTNLKLALFTLLCSCVFASAAMATTYREMTLDELFAQTDIAFYGEVTNIAASERGGDPWTDVTFTVEQPYLGVAEGTETLELSFYGGTLPNGRSFVVNLMPQFQIGDRALIFAYEAELYSPVVGFRQGLWRELNLGLVDETNRSLSLNEEGDLILEGPGAGLDDLLAAVRARFEEQP